MQTRTELETLPDDELIRRLADLVRRSRGTEVDLVAHIGEVDARRLYAREASPSMYAYCTEVLHLSEAEAYLRIAAARASREHPVVLEMLADGRLHLSAIAKLAPHLTAENCHSLLRRATHKSKREVEELLAELQPRPDVPCSIRKVPERRTAKLLSSATRSDGPPDTPTMPPPVGRPGQGEPHAEERRTCELGLRPGKDGSNGSSGLAAPRPATIEPLAPARYKVQFTASAELRDKLERLRALMRSSVPDGDLAAVIETAVTEKLERLEARRFGRGERRRRPVETQAVSSRSGGVLPETAGDGVRPGREPLTRTGEAAPNAAMRGVPVAPEPAEGAATAESPLCGSPHAPASRHVPARVRRAVYAREGGRCHYASDEGRRCTARERLQLHHRHPFALGGEHSVENVGLVCATHNRHLAEVDYGREAMARYRRGRQGILKQAR